MGPQQTGEENVKVLVWNEAGNDFVRVDSFPKLPLNEYVPSFQSYIFNNDVYYQRDPREKESIRVTHDGSPDLLHGCTDWLYEEEILQTSTAMWWSVDGKQLAFLTIDNRKVQKISLFPRCSIPL